DFPELVQKLRSTVIEADDFAKLRPIARFVFNHLAPNLYFPEQQHTTRIIAIFFNGSDNAPERINPMCLYITRRGLIGQPDVISHLDAVEEVVAAPKQSRNRPPSAVRNYLPGTNTLVPELLGKFVAICAHERAHSLLLGWLWLRLDGGCRVGWP